MLTRHSVNRIVLVVAVVLMVLAAGCGNEVLVPIEDQEANPFDTLEFTAEVFPDIETEPSFEASGDLAEYFDPVTATFRWTPGPSDDGDYQITITAVSGEISEQERVRITVHPLEALEFDIDQTPTDQDYPDADAIVLRRLLAVDTTLEDTDHREYYQILIKHHLVKVLTRTGIENHGEIRINFHPEYEIPFILQARTIKPDGSIIEVRDEAIHVITPPELSAANIYSDLQQLVINMPSLEVGSVVAYSYALFQPIERGEFSFVHYFRGADPVKYSRVELVSLDDFPVFFQTTPYDIEPTVTTEREGRQTYVTRTWELTDSDNVLREIALPPLDRLVPLIVASSIDSWDSVSELHAELINEALESRDGVADMVERLTDGRESLEAQIQALYNFVAKDIRYVAVAYGLGGIMPNSPEDVLDAKYGDCKDKSVLLIAMLDEIGVVAEPVLIDVFGNPEVDIVSGSLFNHMIVYLPDQDLFLDPTSDVHLYGHLPYVNQGKNVLLPLSNQLMKTPILPATSNSEAITQHVKLQTDGSAQVQISVASSGEVDAERRAILRGLTQMEQETYFRQNITDSFVDVSSIDYRITGVSELTEPVAIAGSFYTSAYGDFIGDRFAFRPLRFSVDLGPLVASETRRHPLFLGYNMLLVRDVHIELPEGYRINQVPTDILLENEVGTLRVKYETTDNQVVTVHYSLQIDQQQIDVDQYDAFRELVRQSQQAFRNQIVLEEATE